MVDTIQSKSLNYPPGKSLNQFPFKEFKLKNFNLKIFQGEKSIIYQAKEIEDLTDILYKTESSLEELYKMKKIFKQFDSIEEAFNLFFKVLDETKVNIKKKDNKINLTFIIEFMGKKDEIEINLMPEEAKIDTIVMKLCETVKELKNENDNLKKELKDYKNFTENKIKELEALIKKESETLKANFEFNNAEYKTIDEIVKLKSKFEKIDTRIIKYNELNLIETGVKNKLNKKIKKYTLLFRASKDGFKAGNFHSKCDGKNNTVTLVETTNGKRFGGFTDAAWDQSSSYKTGSNSFIFSLDDKSIYYNKNSHNIYCKSDYGPTFGGGHDFYLCDNCNSSNSSSDSSGYSYETNGKKYAMAGEYNFFVKDYEVYLLELE